MALGRLKEAEEVVRKAIQIDPDFAIAHNNLGCILKESGDLRNAENSIIKAIQLQPNLFEAYSNLANTLSDLGRLKEADSLMRKSIKLRPDFAEAHLNLGAILADLGEFKEAESCILKSLELKPNLSRAYFALSRFKYFDKNNILKEKLFSESILSNQLPQDKVDIYFARSNFLHSKSQYEESAKFLRLANKIKLDIFPSNSNDLIEKSQELLIQTFRDDYKLENSSSITEIIFIVGMPRSGTSLLDSILTLNNDVGSLGEFNILEKSYLEWHKSKNSQNESGIDKLYFKKVHDLKKYSDIITDKNPYNYQYVGFICKYFPKAKIIHCYRNPLDNILSIHRANFIRGHEYASSVIDCANVYLDHEAVMREYKSRFRSKIFDLKYEKLVRNPEKEIKSIINWLGWEWDDKYLSPHLNSNSVISASNIQVRYPINSKSVGIWKNYSETLEDAIHILNNPSKPKTS